MNYKFVKRTLVDNGSDLSTILAFNFEISWASIMFFESFRMHFQEGVARSRDKNFQKNFNTF